MIIDLNGNFFATNLLHSALDFELNTLTVNRFTLSTLTANRFTLNTLTINCFTLSLALL